MAGRSNWNRRLRTFCSRATPIPTSATRARGAWGSPALEELSLVVPMLEVLDFCDTSQSAPRRTTTSTAPQALTLFNGAFVNRQARHLAERIAREVGDDPTRQVERAYLLALGRPPSAEESAAMLAFLASESGAPAEGQADRPALLSRVCRVLFNLSEFAYTD